MEVGCEEFVEVFRGEDEGGEVVGSEMLANFEEELWREGEE